jgi:phospholipid/cholesterol/gamma-HCH transport system permease protein
VSFFEVLGKFLIQSYKDLKSIMDLIALTVVNVFIPPFRFKDTIKQFHFIAVESTPIILFCVGFAAIVTIIESSFHMKMVVQNDSMVPGFAALLILREIGAVVPALLMTSRVGAGIAAEVGSMKITEQIDALKMLGLNPVRYLVVPRFLACVVGGFVVTIVASLTCIICAMLVSEQSLGYTYGSFIVAMRSFVSFQDLVFASIKGASFGAVIPIFSCYYGFKCQSGAEGVGLATTNSVVSTSVTIIVLDFILSYAFTFFY